MAGPGVLPVGGVRLSTASSARRSAGARLGLSVGSLVGHMVEVTALVSQLQLEQSQLSHGYCLGTRHHEMVKHAYIDQAQGRLEGLGQRLVGA